jgi:hypothetical protein
VTFRRLLLLALVLAPGVAEAQADGPTRQINLTVYGADRCPEAREDEIVVCARRPEEERYRIPPRLREQRDQPSEISWQARNEVLEEDARQLRPDSCSVVGSGGMTGCQSALVRQWYAERRGRRID